MVPVMKELKPFNLRGLDACTYHVYLSDTFSMRPAPRFEMAACFLSEREGVNFNLSDFRRDRGTVTIT